MSESQPTRPKAIVRNAIQCRICGAEADRYEHMFQCQRHPGHVADLLTGLFSDCTHPEDLAPLEESMNYSGARSVHSEHRRRLPK